VIIYRTALHGRARQVGGNPAIAGTTEITRSIRSKKRIGVGVTVSTARWRGRFPGIHARDTLWITPVLDGTVGEDAGTWHEGFVVTGQGGSEDSEW
jgi:hypothetical protein